MSFRRTVASNIVVQAFGPASAFLTVLLIARLGGPSDQGEFAQLKAFVDLMVAVGSFGFPQGFVYVIHKLGASAPALARWSRLYALAFAPVALAAAIIARHLGYVTSGGTARLSSVVLLTVASTALVLLALWRGVFLTHDSRIRFAVLTMTPAVSLMLGMAVALLVGWRRFDWVILVSTVASLLVAQRMMRPVMARRDPARYRDQPWRALLTNGLHTFIQATLMMLQPLVAYGLVRYHGGGTGDVGMLNAGLFLVQGLTVPITMVGPLLYARWTSSANTGFLLSLRALTWRWLSLEVVAGAALAFAATFLIPVVFGVDYRSAVVPAQAMLFTLPLVCHMRIVAPALHACGRPGVNTFALAIRMVVFIAMTLLLPSVIAGALPATGIAWAISEVAYAFWTLLGLRYASQGLAARAAAECA